MDLTKPVELMTDDERAAYYIARRKALLLGDEGVLPSGKTCRQEREEYEAICMAEAQGKITATEQTPQKKTSSLSLSDAVES